MQCVCMDRIRMPSSKCMFTTTLRECVQEPIDTDTNADVGAQYKPEPVSSNTTESGLLSLPLELNYMILEHYFDAMDHVTLARVCRLWNHILKTSRTARAKRYIDYHNDKKDRGSVSSRPAGGGDDLPDNFKIHMALLIDRNQLYFFKDGASLKDDESSISADAYRLSLKNPYAGLTIFADDPIFIFPDQSLSQNYEAQEDQAQTTSGNGMSKTGSPEDIPSDTTNSGEPEISLSQLFVYKYQTTGMFPSLLGTGVHSSRKLLVIPKSSTVGEYTEILVGQMKDLAKAAREKRCSELTRSTNDKQIISLWERLTATDGEFFIKLNNLGMFYGGNILLLTPDESQLCQSSSSDLFFRSLFNVLEINSIEPSHLLARHPFSDSEDDDD
ncbi:hypothetical protein TWF718_010664 [Orbilia javanica]|uniref:F-box domain-containing protein n=1 Tax=Orbilia javanica TaxID=47235 RepID=A0AAN8NQ32_9PEZI